MTARAAGARDRDRLTEKYGGPWAAHGAASRPTVLERTVTPAGTCPDGGGWTCIHSWANWQGRWWLWQRMMPV